MTDHEPPPGSIVRTKDGRVAVSVEQYGALDPHWFTVNADGSNPQWRYWSDLGDVSVTSVLTEAADLIDAEAGEWRGGDIRWRRAAPPPPMNHGSIQKEDWSRGVQWAINLLRSRAAVGVVGDLTP